MKQLITQDSKPTLRGFNFPPCRPDICLVIWFDVVEMKLPSTTLHHFLLAKFTLAFAAVQWPLTSPSTGGITNSNQGLNLSDNMQLKKTTSSGWQLNVHRVWDVLGPFPQSAREQHFLSPSYPLDCKWEPSVVQVSHCPSVSRGWNVSPNETYQSSLQDGGTVGWSSTTSVGERLEVVFPNVRYGSHFCWLAGSYT